MLDFFAGTKEKGSFVYFFSAAMGKNPVGELLIQMGMGTEVSRKSKWVHGKLKVKKKREIF